MYFISFRYGFSPSHIPGSCCLLICLQLCWSILVKAFPLQGEASGVTSQRGRLGRVVLAGFSLTVFPDVSVTLTATVDIPPN